MFRLVLGFLLMTLGLIHLFHPTIILRINAFMRESVFRDSYVLFSHKRVGAFLLIIGFLLMAIGLRRLG